MSKTTAMYRNWLRNPYKYNLSEEQKEFFSENGYLVIKKLFDKPTLDSFRQRFREICNDQTLSLSYSIIKDKKLASTSSNPEDYVNKIQDILEDPVFIKYSEDPRLLHIVSQLIGDELAALNCMLINKPPASSRRPPHQDAFYFPIRPLTAVASWTAVDVATRDNGCLYVIPGSHTLHILPHQAFQDSKKFFHSIADEARHAPEERRVYLEMEPGDTVLFSPHLVHGSGPNLSKGYRKAMTIHYMDSRCEFIDLAGTAQELVVRDFERVVQKNGLPESYQVMWKLKSKILKAAKSHL